VSEKSFLVGLVFWSVSLIDQKTKPTKFFFGLKNFAKVPINLPLKKKKVKTLLQNFHFGKDLA
jgi:hypothetical protein